MFELCQTHRNEWNYPFAFSSVIIPSVVPRQVNEEMANDHNRV